MDKDTLLAELTDPEVVAGCLVVLYASQTPQEQAGHTTVEVNGEGFNAFDADFGTSLAEQVIGKGTLTTKQVAAGRKIVRKYAGQISRRVDESPRQPLGVRTVSTDRPVESDLTEIPL
jgi:hypothetical protein